MAKKINIVFNEKTGKFVINFKGVPTHEEEHRLLETLLQKLRDQGYDADVKVAHQDKPKLPDVDSDCIRDPKKEGGR